MPDQSIVCFGEVLWDVLPTGKIAGGAPMNVAYHARVLGLPAQMVSRVGADDPGRELLGFLNDKGIPTKLVQRDHTFPTGTVNVRLDAKGAPTYEIVQPAAWDFIHPDEAAQQAVEAAGTLVFGSLACRTEGTRNTLFELLEHATVRVFDVNLRPPFFSMDLLETLLRKATMVKMNDEELERLGVWFGASGTEAEKMRYLKKLFQLDALIVTKGAHGAEYLNDISHYTHPGFTVNVQDTIGSGDAFLGAFLSQSLQGASAEESLETACAAGALVATKKGATPDYSPSELFQFKHMKKVKQLLLALFFLALAVTGATAQGRLFGTVVDAETREPLIGASLVIVGTSGGTITQLDGTYSLDLPAGAPTITVSYLGYASKTITEVQPGPLDIGLTQGSVLDEVIVVGYTTQKKGDITGAVSVVDVQSIAKTPYSNVLQALQGKVSGVQFTQDGQPGSGRTSIRIRGVTTLNNNNPLYVVDGVPTVEDLNNLNPNDIESIQVLKDAAAASIYGSRSAGGVVVITTKKGKAGKTSVEAGMLNGVQTLARKVEVLDPVQWGEVWWTASQNAGITPKHPAYGSGATPQLVVTPFIIPNGRQIYQYTPEGTDWADEIYQNAFQQQYYVNLSGGNDRGTYAAGVNYFDQDGLIKHTNFNRITSRLNSNFKVADWLNVGENLSVALYQQVQIGSQQGQDGIPLDVIRQHPALPVYDLEGGFAGKIGGFPDVRNMVSVLEKNKNNTSDSRRIFGNAYAEADLFKMLDLLPAAHSLRLKSTYGIDYSNYYLRRFDAAFQEGDFDIQNNLLFNEFGVGTTLTWINTLNYGYEAGNHSLNVLGGHEQITYDFTFLNGARTGFENEDPAFTYLSAGSGSAVNGGGGTEWALRSYFGRADYTFMNRYIVSGTLRFDETSRLLTSGIFPAASIGWRVSEESFFKKAFGNKFDDLKLRASWGQQGNQQIGDFATISTLGADINHADYDLGGTNNTVSQGFRVLSRGNPNLVWETTTQTNVGFDAGFGNGKFTIGADYYIKNTDDILLRAPQIAAIGEGDEPFVNAASVRNTGIDLLLGYHHSKPGKDLRYDVSFQLSHFTNEVTSLGKNIGNLGNEGESYLNGNDGPTRIAVGKPIGSFYGWVYDGIFQDQAEVEAAAIQAGKGVGRIRYRDLNADGVIDDRDRTYIGSPYPDLNLGLDLGLEWKGLSFSAALYSGLGQQVYNEVLTYTDFAQVGSFNRGERILDAWSPENTDSRIPAPTLDNTNNELRASSYFVEDASYVRLRSVKLGYSLPKFLTGKNITANIYVEAQNVATVSGYSGIDPEVPYAGNSNFPGIDRGVYPLPRTFLLGMNFRY